MMIGNSRKGYHQGTKQEGDSSTDHHRRLLLLQHHNMNVNGVENMYSKVGSSSSSSSSSWGSRQWSSGLRNPRIVRVSRSFGGKDRHSKVCTIRGLRDRRIRLSVPTAIQLYDLQDRLGVSQPSKVIDWLIEATKLDIDKLPPLQIPHGFPQFLHPPPPQIHLSSSSSLNAAAAAATFMDAHAAAKGIRVDQDHDRSLWEKGKWVMKTNTDDDDDGGGGGGTDHQGVQNLLPPMTYYNNSNPSYSYHMHSGHYSSNRSLFGSHGLFLPNNSNSQVDPAALVAHNSSNSTVQFQVPSNSSAATLLPPSVFGPYCNMMNMGNNTSTVGEIHESTRLHLNHFQLLSSTNSHPHHPHPHHLHLPVVPTPVLPFTSSLLLDSDHNQKQDTTGPSR